jgi:glucose-1-phosphate cytidylyltransferase
MKVVLFCGGQGMRMRDYDERVPKPLVPIGPRPVLWHVMKYYAHFGHNEFVLCLGYGDRLIKEYFLEYKEWLSNDFVLGRGGAEVEMLHKDLDSWSITFVDTGLTSQIGERLRRVREYVEGDGMFLANYSDCLTDLHLPDVIQQHLELDAIGTMTVVPPNRTFHVVDADRDGRVDRVGPVTVTDLWINGGYLVLDDAIFDELRPGEDLVGDAFPRLAARGRLGCHRYTGNWMSVDTFKERQEAEELYLGGSPFWAVWHREADDSPLSTNLLTPF